MHSYEWKAEGIHFFGKNQKQFKFMPTELLSLCVSHAGQAAWSGDVNSTKRTRLVIQATVSRGYHPGGLWASYSWHVWSLICLNMPFYHWTLAQLQISCIQCDVSILNIKSKNMVFLHAYFASLMLYVNMHLLLMISGFVAIEYGVISSILFAEMSWR